MFRDLSTDLLGIHIVRWIFKYQEFPEPIDNGNSYFVHGRVCPAGDNLNISTSQNVWLWGVRVRSSYFSRILHQIVMRNCQFNSKILQIFCCVKNALSSCRMNFVGDLHRRYDGILIGSGRAAQRRRQAANIGNFPRGEKCVRRILKTSHVCVFGGNCLYIAFVASLPPVKDLQYYAKIRSEIAQSISIRVNATGNPAIILNDGLFAIRLRLNTSFFYLAIHGAIDVESSDHSQSARDQCLICSERIINVWVQPAPNDETADECKHRHPTVDTEFFVPRHGGDCLQTVRYWQAQVAT